MPVGGSSRLRERARHALSSPSVNRSKKAWTVLSRTFFSQISLSCSNKSPASNVTLHMGQVAVLGASFGC